MFREKDRAGKGHVQASRPGLAASIAAGKTVMTETRPRYMDYDRGHMPVTGMATDYPAGHVTPLHSHPHAQLIYAVQGVTVVSTGAGQWVLPPTRGMWVPAGVLHETRMVTTVHMRTVYIRPDAVEGLPAACSVIGISDLLRELLLAAVTIAAPYAQDSRDGRLMRLLLDEIRAVTTLGLHLQHPQDSSLKTISEAILRNPDDNATLQDWSARLGMDAKTIQRRFARETGMSFGQWRQQARLLLALEQLAAGRKVVDVALDLGYSSASAFATMFKKQLGHSPASFFGK